jgi:hypothetical protein
MACPTGTVVTVFCPALDLSGTCTMVGYNAPSSNVAAQCGLPASSVIPGCTDAGGVLDFASVGGQITGNCVEAGLGRCVLQEYVPSCTRPDGG